MTLTCNDLYGARGNSYCQKQKVQAGVEADSDQIPSDNGNVSCTWKIVTIIESILLSSEDVDFLPVGMADLSMRLRSRSMDLTVYKLGEARREENWERKETENYSAERVTKGCPSLIYRRILCNLKK